MNQEKETLGEAMKRITGYSPEELFAALGGKIEPLQEELISHWCPKEHNLTTWRRAYYPETDNQSARRVDTCATCGAEITNLG